MTREYQLNVNNFSGVQSAPYGVAGEECAHFSLLGNRLKLMKEQGVEAKRKAGKFKMIASETDEPRRIYLVQHNFFLLIISMTIHTPCSWFGSPALKDNPHDQCPLKFMAENLQATGFADQAQQESLQREARPSTSSTDSKAIFHNIYTYPWDQDSEFQSGLTSIRGGNTNQHSLKGTTEHDIDLLLQAQCFYFARYEIVPEGH